MPLIDIEVLVEKISSAPAKSFVQEAVNCYRAGAYRSCVVATWVALVYDFVEKFRDLALSGDSAAKTLVIEFDRIQQERDTTAALKFEREVLDIAKDEYELLSPQEYVDLKRLFEDRNRFGHPNINQDSDILSATPELARNHLRNAVEHVMSRPPVQGKVAIQAVQSAVDSQYFPRTVDDALVALASTPIARAKRALVREFFLGCVISLLREKPPAETFERRCAAAQACMRMHSEVVDEVIQTKITAVLDKTDDANLGYLVVLLSKIPKLISRVSEALKVRLKAYAKDLPEKELSVVNFASDLHFLSAEVICRLEQVTPSQLREFVQRSARSPTRPVINRAVRMLEESKSWDSSNSICAAITERMLEQLTVEDAGAILRANSNGEVKWSFNYPPLLIKLVERGLLDITIVKSIADGSGVPALKAELDAYEEKSADVPKDPAGPD